MRHIIIRDGYPEIHILEVCMQQKSLLFSWFIGSFI